MYECTGGVHVYDVMLSFCIVKRISPLVEFRR